MEARATINGTSVSKTFVAAVLVLVAMGLGAMGGYVAKGLSASGTSAAGTVQAHPAPGTVLRQDNPARHAVELPGYVQGEIDRAAQPTPGISTTDPNFIRQYAQQPAADSQVRGTRGDHGELQ